MPVKTRKPPVIRLDPSKPFSEVRGDRLPNDPHYHVAFIQDTLPFDVDNVLVPDDGKREPWTTIIDKETIVHSPLYTDAMRAKVARKLERLAKGLPAIEEAAEEEEEEEDDVNLAMWLRGEVEYQDQELYAAAKKRYSVNYSKRAQLVVDLVYDHKLVAEDDVAAALRPLLKQAA